MHGPIIIYFLFVTHLELILHKISLQFEIFIIKLKNTFVFELFISFFFAKNVHSNQQQTIYNVLFFGMLSIKF